jgi:hypothetical protein
MEMDTRTCEVAVAPLEFRVLDVDWILSDEFAAQLKVNPEDVLRQIGVEPTSDILEALNRLDIAELKELTRTFYAPKAGIGPGDVAMP